MLSKKNKSSSNLWLIGAGLMGQDYAKVLLALNKDVTVIGRSEKSAEIFQKATGLQAQPGGLKAFLNHAPAPATHAIVAVNREHLSEVTCQLLQVGVKRILVEKPAGLSKEEIQNIQAHARGADVVIGFNRRFYSSVREAKYRIQQDGGAQSFSFEFTEWAHKLDPLVKTQSPKVMSTWFLGNSIHVADLAFYLGGYPKELAAFSRGGLPWHPKASIFAGAGVSQANALFSYQANWDAPGRWGVEALTARHRWILRPLEELHVQKKGAIAIEKVGTDDALDKQFKPGLFLQVQRFLAGTLEEFCTIDQLAHAFDFYLKIAHYC